MLNRLGVTVATNGKKKIITRLSRRCHAGEAAPSRANLSDIDVLLMSRTSKQGPINLRWLLTQKLKRGKKDGKTCITMRGGQNQQVHDTPFKLPKPPRSANHALLDGLVIKCNLLMNDSEKGEKMKTEPLKRAGGSGLVHPASLPDGRAAAQKGRTFDDASGRG